LLTATLKNSHIENSKITKGDIARITLTVCHGRWKCLKVGGASSGWGHGEPLVGGQGGEAPLKLKAFWFLNVPRSGKTYPVVSS